MTLSYSSPRLDAIDQHPWWREPENRKFALQNVPEEYRWHRLYDIAVPTAHYPTAVQAIVYPSDWHNIVEYMMPPAYTKWLVIILEDIAREWGLGSELGVIVWRTVIRNWMYTWRGSANTLMRNVFDMDGDGHRASVRAERWSKRIRSQKTLIQRIQEGAGGHPGYFNTTFRDNVSTFVADRGPFDPANLTRMVDSAAKQLAPKKEKAAQKGITLDTVTLFGYPTVHDGFSATEETITSRLRALSAKSGATILLPKELPQEQISRRIVEFGRHGWTVQRWAEIPIAKKPADGPWRYAMLNGTGYSAKTDLGTPDLLAKLREMYPDMKPIERVVPEVRKPDPKRVYAVPTTFEEVVAAEPVEPEPEWAPPAMPGVGGSR